DTVQKSVGQNGMMTQLGNLPGIVGLPTLDHLLGGVERIFGPKKSESQSEESTSPMEGPSRDESGRRGSLFGVPSFLRRKSTQMSDGRRARERRQSLPSMRVNSFGIDHAVQADNMTEPGRASPSVIFSDSDGEQLKEE